MAKKVKSERKIIRTARHEIVVNIYDDKSTDMERTNDGFSVIELLGVIELARDHLLKCFNTSFNEENIKLKASNAPLIHTKEG